MTREATPDVPATPDADTEETVSRNAEETVSRDQPSSTPNPSTLAPDPAKSSATSPTLSEDAPSTRSRSNSIQTQKERLIYEIEQDEKVFEKTEKPLEDAIEKHQEQDREAYHILIKENVALSRQNRKLVDQTQEQSAQMEVLKVGLQGHQERNGELETKLKGMEVEMKALIKAAQKRGISRPQTAVEDENNNRDLEEIEESDPPEVRHRKQQQKRIRDLQYRLLRMTTDMEDKDQRLEELERRNGELGALVEEYEPLVDPDKVGEVRGRVCADPCKDSENMHVDQRGNVIRQNGNASSSICVVM